MPVYFGSQKVSIFAGAGSTKAQSKSIAPTESQQIVTPDEGYDCLSQVTVGAISSVMSEVVNRQKCGGDLYALATSNQTELEANRTLAVLRTHQGR